MTSRPPRRSPLAMAVLLLLAEEPMHPYGLRQRIRERDKDRVINVTQRNAIYQIIERLERTGLIKVRETARNENRPERTVYETTDQGAATAQEWLLAALSTPADEFPEFPAALAFLGSTTHEEILTALEARAKALADKIASLETEVEAGIAAFPGGVERIYLLEIEYLHRMWEAERAWVTDVVDELRAGRLTSLVTRLKDARRQPGRQGAARQKVR